MVTFSKQHTMSLRKTIAFWKIFLPEGEFLIEFDHGTTSGKRVIYINGKEIFHKDWMFRLVGPEIFRIGRFECKLDVEPDGLLGLSYSFSVNGIRIEDFLEICKKNYSIWMISLKEQKHRVVLEKDSLDVWVDGSKTESTVQFVDGGIEIVFLIEQNQLKIESKSSGNKKEGMFYHLVIGAEKLHIESL